MYDIGKEFESLRNKVKVCSVLPVLEVVEHPKVGVTFIDYLKEVEVIEVDGERQAIEIIEQTDKSLALKSPQVMPLLDQFLTWDKDRIIKSLQERFATNGGSVEYPLLSTVEILETVAETLENALTQIENGDQCLRDIAHRTAGGAKFVSFLASHYQNSGRAKELLFKAADELYAKQQLQP